MYYSARPQLASETHFFIFIIIYILNTHAHTHNVGTQLSDVKQNYKNILSACLLLFFRYDSRLHVHVHVKSSVQHIYLKLAQEDFYNIC